MHSFFVSHWSVLTFARWRRSSVSGTAVALCVVHSPAFSRIVPLVCTPTYMKFEHIYTAQLVDSTNTKLSSIHVCLPCATPATTTPAPKEMAATSGVRLRVIVQSRPVTWVVAHSASRSCADSVLFTEIHKYIHKYMEIINYHYDYCQALLLLPLSSSETANGKKYKNRHENG